MTDTPEISIVSPVYGCTDCLDKLVSRVRESFEGTPLTWELVLVDDRGPDDPWPLIEEMASSDPRVRGVRLMRNHGQHLAIWAGLGVARGNWVAVIDCDLQDDPVVLPDLLKTALAKKVDAVVVDRGDWSDSLFRRAASRAFHWMMTLLAGFNLRNIGNFGLYSRRLVKVLLMYEDKEVFLPAMVVLTGLPVTGFRLDRSERHAGASSYSLGSLIRLSIAITVRFSDRPLKLSVIVGLFISCLSAMISFLLLVLWASGKFTVQGWTSTILSMWFLSGLILATLGVHGFYIGRVFREVQRRPRILVECTTGQSDMGARSK